MSFVALPALGRIGRYQIYEELAEGGMARVFLAQRDGSSRLCVLKQLHGELEEHRTAAIRFQREAHLVSQLDHPNIARVIDAGVEDGKFCIAMELIEGVTLQQMLDAMADRHRIVPPALTLTIATEVLSGLAYAHSLRGGDGRHLEIVHRDLSPANVMVTYDGRVKIIDFGVAQGRIDGFRTAPGMIVGTLHYMSPEQALTERTDHRSDIYALSVLLWELLAGRPAVRDGKAIEVLEQVIEETPPSLHLLDPGLPRAISDAVMRGLEKAPEDRWQSAAAYHDALVSATRTVGRASWQEMGAAVCELFPPDEQPASRWTQMISRHADVLADAPTIADGDAATYELIAPSMPATISGSTTQPDKTPPLELIPSGSEITRPDTLLENTRAADRLHAKVADLEQMVARQRRIIILLSLLLASVLGLVVSAGVIGR